VDPRAVDAAAAVNAVDAAAGSVAAAAAVVNAVDAAAGSVAAVAADVTEKLNELLSEFAGEQHTPNNGIWHHALGLFGLNNTPQAPAVQEEKLEKKQEKEQEVPAAEEGVEDNKEEKEPEPASAVPVAIAVPVDVKKDIVIHDIEYPEQFTQLKQMGFTNEWQIVVLLKKHKGDVQTTALELLDSA